MRLNVFEQGCLGDVGGVRRPRGWGHPWNPDGQGWAGPWTDNICWGGGPTEWAGRRRRKCVGWTLLPAPSTPDQLSPCPAACFVRHGAGGRVVRQVPPAPLCSRMPVWAVHRQRAGSSPAVLLCGHHIHQGPADLIRDAGPVPTWWPRLTCGSPRPPLVQHGCRVPCRRTRGYGSQSATSVLRACRQSRCCFSFRDRWCGMRIPDEIRDQLAVKFAVLFPHVNERQRRLLMAVEARVLGHGSEPRGVQLSPDRMMTGPVAS